MHADPVSVSHRRFTRFLQVFAFGLLAIFTLATAFVFYWKWDSAKNRGLTTGYWGQYNRTSNALASIPGVTITQHWLNLDMTLEEFGLEVETNGTRVKLFFGESDPIRTMPREKAVAALKVSIHEGLVRTNK